MLAVPQSRHCMHCSHTIPLHAPEHCGPWVRCSAQGKLPFALTWLVLLPLPFGANLLSLPWHSYVERYGLGEPSDDIESVLKRVALTLGKKHKVKVLTGTGECPCRPGTPWGAGESQLGVGRDGQLSAPPCWAESLAGGG